MNISAQASAGFMPSVHIAREKEGVCTLTLAYRTNSSLEVMFTHPEEYNFLVCVRIPYLRYCLPTVLSTDTKHCNRIFLQHCRWILKYQTAWRSRWRHQNLSKRRATTRLNDTAPKPKDSRLNSEIWSSYRSFRQESLTVACSVAINCHCSYTNWKQPPLQRITCHDPSGVQNCYSDLEQTGV